MLSCPNQSSLLQSAQPWAERGREGEAPRGAQHRLYNPLKGAVTWATEHPTAMKVLSLQFWYTQCLNFYIFFPDTFLDAFICLLGSRAPVAWGNFFVMRRPNSKTLIQCCKASLWLWRAEDSNSWKQQALLAFDSEHNSAAWGFGVSVRLEKSFGHVLGVLNVVWHQSLLFGVWEWEAEVIDIRQASVLSLRGIGMWWVEQGF